MAAAVLESVAVPRASAAFHRPAAVAPSPRVAVIAARPLPECRGLRIARMSPRVPSIARKGRRRGVVCEAQNTAVGNVPDVTKETWQSLVLESEVPVLVEFWAPWCGPCRMLLPTIEELSKEYAGRLKCLKINTDDCPEIANQFGIRSIPTIIVFKNGEKKDAVIGAVPKSTLTTCIEKFV